VGASRAEVATLSLFKKNQRSFRNTNGSSSSLLAYGLGSYGQTQNRFIRWQSGGQNPGPVEANNGFSQITMAVATQKPSFKMSIAIFFESMGFFPFLFR
jgi:hypothetical protein